jgi:outer membrane lipoprotein-sorting protein
VSLPARALLAGAAVALAGIVAHGAPTGEELLRHSKQAERSHNYRGLRVTRMSFPRRTVTAQAWVVHRRPATTRIEYRSPPSLAGTVVLQMGAERWRWSPREQRWRRAAGPAEVEALDLLLRNYDLRPAPGSPVARRDCVLLLINPKHEGNPSKRLWIDRATGLCLRSELLNWKQDGISVSVFEEIEIDPDLSRESRNLTPPVPLAPPPPGTLSFKPAYPRYLPAGYVFVGTDVIRMGKHCAAHLRYSDGLNTISVFQAPGAAFAQQEPFANVGLSFAQVIAWRGGGLAYAIVGDVNPEELRRMADSITPTASRQH